MFVERHKINPTPEIIELAKASKDLYNKCNYYMRHRWFKNLKEDNWDIQLPDINLLTKLTQNEESFKNLHNTKTAKQTIRKCLADWSNFKKTLKAYKKDPSRFLGKPKAPYYKEKLAQVIFYNETIRKKPLKDNIITPTNDCFKVKSKIKNFHQVIITPKTFGFVVEISYEKETKKEKLNKNHVCNIDLGVNNLCAITSDQHSPLLINGRIAKSINQHYNKNVCKRTTSKRYWRLENYFHNASKFIIENCIKHQIGTIIIGKNDGWKQNIKMRKKNKQNFFYIPFNKLIEKIQYKAVQVGIKVIFTEESYTSKASFLDRDFMPVYGHEEKPKFSGSRVKRGLYKSSNGTLLNADVNGASNICRKVIKDIDILNQLDRSLAARPRLINPLKAFYIEQ